VLLAAGDVNFLAVGLAGDVAQDGLDVVFASSINSSGGRECFPNGYRLGPGTVA